MYKGNRRKFNRVTFKENIEIQSGTWSDLSATGLDISLNGCRFNCEQSLTEGETVSLTFKTGLVLKGNTRWCWPIEWYYLSAVHFENISNEEQKKLKQYIKEVTGEDYQMEKEDENSNEIDNDANKDEFEIDIENIDDLDDLSFDDEDEDNNEKEFDVVKEDHSDEDSVFSEHQNEVDLNDSNTEKENDLYNLPPLDEKDLADIDTEEPPEKTVSRSETLEDNEFIHKFADGDLSPISFKGKEVIIFNMKNDQAELLSKYLNERIGMEVECVNKKHNLWRHLKIDPMDLVIIEAGAEGDSDALEVMQQTKDQFPDANYICISGPVSLERRIQFLNAGALDYLTRPIHLSTIAQSILIHLSRIDHYIKSPNNENYDTNFYERSSKISNIKTTETFHDEDLTGTLDLLDEDLNVSQEIELVDEEF